MNLWFDLANSPHVLFFKPFLDRLAKTEHAVWVSMRDFSHTVDMATNCGIDAVLIGAHGGSSRIGKFINLAARAHALKRFARRKGFDVAASHNSYTQILAAQRCGIKTVTLMDYEGQPANHLAFRLAKRIIVPHAFPEDALRRFGASPRRTYKYHGFKEQVYLSQFVRDPGFEQQLRDSCDLSSQWTATDNVLVVLRTPATMAMYHRFRNPLFDALLEYLDTRRDLTVVVIPRTPNQKAAIDRRYVNIRTPRTVLSGENLIDAADIVISAGGTMNREAALLGTPCYTIFAGDIPAVDRELIGMGRMTAIRTAGDLRKIRYAKKGETQSLQNPRLCDELLSVILGE